MARGLFSSTAGKGSFWGNSPVIDTLSKVVVQWQQLNRRDRTPAVTRQERKTRGASFEETRRCAAFLFYL